MGRKAEKLTAAKVRSAGPGRYGDGDGLFLLVKPDNARYWVFRYRNRDTPPRLREMGLGRAGYGQSQITLEAARAKAGPLWREVRAGTDPLTQKATDKAARHAAVHSDAINAITFVRAADAYITAHEVGWRNAKHRWQWRASLETFVFPHMGALPVSDVATAHVLAALEPIWKEKTETASRVRGRIEVILDYAKARDWRFGENPARWRGHLDHLLPARSKVAKVVHHAALPWREVGTFMPALRRQAGIAARALEFAILTAARTGEVLGASWDEVDLARAVWTIPGARMKAGREHRVPLSAAALAILSVMASLRSANYLSGPLFLGKEASRPLSSKALLMTLRRMGRGDLTVHGFRSTFRDWAGEATGYPSDVAEAALAHSRTDKTVAAYARGDLFDKRRALMNAWADYCATPTPSTGTTVIPLRQVG